MRNAKCSESGLMMIEIVEEFQFPTTERKALFVPHTLPYS